MDTDGVGMDTDGVGMNVDAVVDRMRRIVTKETLTRDELKILMGLFNYAHLAYIDETNPGETLQRVVSGGLFLQDMLNRSPFLSPAERRYLEATADRLDEKSGMMPGGGSREEWKRQRDMAMAELRSQPPQQTPATHSVARLL
jgi:hypothetical protein